jgi:hypothetical protein
MLLNCSRATVSLAMLTTVARLANSPLTTCLPSGRFTIHENFAGKNFFLNFLLLLQKPSQPSSESYV